MKYINKYIVEEKDYRLNVINNCILFYNNLELKLENIALITNTVTNTVIYNPHCIGLGGTLLKGKLTLNTTLSSDSSDTDILMIFLQENIEYVGINKNSTTVQETNSYILKDILTELKINNQHLSLITNNEITEKDLI